MKYLEYNEIISFFLSFVTREGTQIYRHVFDLVWNDTVLLVDTLTCIFLVEKSYSWWLHDV